MDLMCDWGNRLELQVTRSEQARYRTAIGVFLRDYEAEIKHASESRQSDYIRWMCWCTLRAASRPSLNPKSSAEIRAEAEGLFKEVLRIARSRLIPGPFPSMSVNTRQKLISELELVGGRFEKRVQEIQDDYLCPGFKMKLSERRRKSVLAQVTAPRLFPDGSEERPLLIRAEEAFEARALDVISSLDSLTLFWFLVEAIDIEWSPREWNIFGSPTSIGHEGRIWPALVTMHPSSRPSTSEVE